jgi:hypothetical protein
MPRPPSSAIAVNASVVALVVVIDRMLFQMDRDMHAPRYMIRAEYSRGTATTLGRITVHPVQGSSGYSSIFRG